MERVHAELADRVPTQERTGVVHGDFRLGHRPFACFSLSEGYGHTE